MKFEPSIGTEVSLLRPDFRALSILVHGVSNAPSDDHSAAELAAAVQDMNSAAWAAPHLDAWRDAYRAFGAKPQRTPCSAEALRKRSERDGTLPPVNAVVDLYNAISLRYAIPVGGEDAAAYRGSPRLIRATGSETFDTMSDGAPKLETVDAGEVVWCDDEGVTCRRWNWRQGTRTRITEASTSLWFVLERLEPMPLDALTEAGDTLLRGLRRLNPTLESEIEIIGA